MNLEGMFSALWQDYTQLNPHVLKVHGVFTSAGDIPLNDHVAFRTFNHSKLNLDKMAQFFLDHGYESKGEYHFKVKKLYARHFEPRQEGLPKVFISELLCEQLSAPSQKLIAQLVEQVPDTQSQREDFCVSGRPWNVSYENYTALLNESEYAAWMSAFGFRANHFTVFVNALKNFSNLEAVNQALKSAGCRLNTSGGEIKGSAQIGLMQSSTMAEPVEVQFQKGSEKIPGCYYEFAQRFPVNGELYQGFVEQSADKIFESTNVKS